MPKFRSMGGGVMDFVRQKMLSFVLGSDRMGIRISGNKLGSHKMGSKISGNRLKSF